MEVKRLSEVKCSKLCSVATNVVRRSLMTMMTFTEVKGQQRSNVVIYVIWLPIWPDVPLIQAKDDDHLYEG